MYVRLTGMPRSIGSTGCRKGRDSGSCLYRDSRVGINACRNSSGLKTEKREQETQKTGTDKSLMRTYLGVILYISKHWTPSFHENRNIGSYFSCETGTVKRTLCRLFCFHPPLWSLSSCPSSCLLSPLAPAWSPTPLAPPFLPIGSLCHPPSNRGQNNHQNLTHSMASMFFFLKSFLCSSRLYLFDKKQIQQKWKYCEILYIYF